MRGIVVVAVFGVGIAHADRVELLRGRLAIEVPGGVAVSDDIARVETENVALTVVARDLGAARLAEVREQIARQLSRDGEPLARIERLALARPTVGYFASVRAPRVVDGRELVYAAFAVDPNGVLRELAFFGEADTLDRSSAAAARIASTITLRPEHPPVVMTPKPPPAPRWSPPVECKRLTEGVWSDRDGDPLPLRVAPVYGLPTVWSVWRGSDGFHAEAIEHDVHVFCSAKRFDQLERAVQAAGKPPP